MQDLIDQLKDCIATLSLLLQNKTEQEKQMLSNLKSYSDKKRSNAKQLRPLSSSPSSLSSISTPSHLTFSKKSTSHENNLVYEDITVRQCNPSHNREHKSMTDFSL